MINLRRLPYNYQEVLEIMIRHPEGLSTREIMDEIKKIPYTDIDTRNYKMLSNLLNTLRVKHGIIDTVDCPENGRWRVYKIRDDAALEIGAELNPIASVSTLAEAAKLAEALSQSLKTIAEQRVRGPISDRQAKIETLTKLASISSPEIESDLKEVIQYLLEF